MPELLLCWRQTFPTLFLEPIYFSPELSEQYPNLGHLLCPSSGVFYCKFGTIKFHAVF